MLDDEDIKGTDDKDIDAGADIDDVVSPGPAFTPDEIEEDAKPEDKTVTVQPVQFASFEDLDQVQGPPNQNLNILLDVKLQLTVELGKTELQIKKVLKHLRGDLLEPALAEMRQKMHLDIGAILLLRIGPEAGSPGMFQPGHKVAAEGFLILPNIGPIVNGHLDGPEFFLRFFLCRSVDAFRAALDGVSGFIKAFLPLSDPVLKGPVL